MKEIKYELDKDDINYSDWAIYYIRNLVNEKLYIGSSIHYQQRLLMHYNELTNNKHKNLHLQYSWNKYKEENFEFGILEYIDSNQYDNDDLREIEQIYMDYFNVCDDAFGYNISETATGVSRKMPKEQRKKISEANKGKIVTEETRKRLSEAKKGHCYMSEELKKRYSEMYSGEGNPFYGKTHTEETKEKIREFRKTWIPTDSQLQALENGRGTKYYTEETYKKLSEANRGEKCGTSKLKESDVIEILKLIKNKVNYKIIGSKFNISLGHISDIKYARTWRYLYEQQPELYPWNP